jgi:hypothetical protein
LSAEEAVKRDYRGVDRVQATAGVPQDLLDRKICGAGQRRNSGSNLAHGLGGKRARRWHQRDSRDDADVDAPHQRIGNQKLLPQESSSSEP